VLSLAYGAILLVAAFRGTINYPLVLAVLVLTSSLMTMLSLAVSVFYRNLSEWFFVGVGILLVNSLPMISYALPSFAPAWMTWLPSYPAVFAVRGILFHGAGLAEVAPALGYLLAGNLVAFGASYWAVQRRLMKEGR
jgi:ABC-2 type transport system permease protein/fluoroquinolone transport system permease protein